MTFFTPHTLNSLMADRSGKPRYESMKKKRVRNDMAISEAETSKVSVLLTESDIPDTSIAGRKPVQL